MSNTDKGKGRKIQSENKASNKEKTAVPLGAKMASTRGE